MKWNPEKGGKISPSPFLGKIQLNDLYGYIILGAQQYPEWIFIQFRFISGWSVLEYLGGQCESCGIKESPWGRENNSDGSVKDPAGTFRAVVVISNPSYTAATRLQVSLKGSEGL